MIQGTPFLEDLAYNCTWLPVSDVLRPTNSVYTAEKRKSAEEMFPTTPPN